MTKHNKKLIEWLKVSSFFRAVALAYDYNDLDLGHYFNGATPGCSKKTSEIIHRYYKWQNDEDIMLEFRTYLEIVEGFDTTKYTINNFFNLEIYEREITYILNWTDSYFNDIIADLELSESDN
jgi:hypothetical protein